MPTNEELKKIHESFGGRWEDSIRGFSINNTRQIFVKRSDLDKVMLVIGHEIGHVLSHSLPDKKNEEAKAFAFEIAWMKTIVEQNIANLKDNIAIDFTPAKNGLHDISFNFVRKIISAGKRALDVYWGLMYGIIEVNQIVTSLQVRIEESKHNQEINSGDFKDVEIDGFKRWQ